MESTPSTPDRIVLVTFGLGGCTAYLAPQKDFGTCFIQGYEHPETWDQHAHEYENRPTPTIVEGAILLDKRAVLENDPRTSFNSPLVDPALQSGEEERLSTENVSETMLRGLGGSFRLLAAHKKANSEWRGLDSVSVDAYVQWWTERGAKVGVFANGRSQWQSEQVPTPSTTT